MTVHVSLAVPGTEAHGGYAFCGFAALILLKQHKLCDIRRLLVREGGNEGCICTDCM